MKSWKTFDTPGLCPHTRSRFRYLSLESTQKCRGRTTTQYILCSFYVSCKTWCAKLQQIVALPRLCCWLWRLCFRSMLWIAVNVQWHTVTELWGFESVCCSNQANVFEANVFEKFLFRRQPMSSKFEEQTMWKLAKQTENYRKTRAFDLKCRSTKTARWILHRTITTLSYTCLFYMHFILLAVTHRPTEFLIIFFDGFRRGIM